MNKQTTVTVVIPAYNAEEFVEYAVKSCAAQTLDSVETIVVNDGSTDSTAKKVSGLEGSRSNSSFRLRLIGLAKNMGAANALKVGFSEAEGTYVCWLSADDMFLDKEKLKKQVSTMKKTSAAWSYFKNYYAGPNPGQAVLIKGSYLPGIRTLNPLFANNSELRLMALLFRNPINGSSVMIKKTVSDTLGTFDPITRNVDLDGDLWMRYSALNLKLTAINGEPVFYREHSRQTSKKTRSMMFGSELTRVRMLIALVETDQLARLIKRFSPFLPLFVETKSYLGRPLTSEYLFTYVLKNQRKFCSGFRKYAVRALTRLDRQIAALRIDREEFRREVELFRRSPTFGEFEKILSRSNRGS